MSSPVPYCGIAPSPGTLLERFNLDPVLALALLLLFAAHRQLLSAPTPRGAALRRCAAAGWAVAALAFMSPLCALSVSLFTARIAQHMVLLLLAAPLIARALPARPRAGGLWLWSGVFMGALWFWHMPVPYDATFASTSVYWLMHATLFGSAILLWRELLHHEPGQGIGAFAAGMFTSMQMALLGALLACAAHPMFIAHLATTMAWGLTPLQDQQLGGAVMWVPGMLVFLWVALRSLLRSGAAGRFGLAR